MSGGAGGAFGWWRRAGTLTMAVAAIAVLIAACGSSSSPPTLAQSKNRPFWGQPPAPDPMPPGERWRIQALVTNYGSAEVQRLLRVWAEVARKIENADEVIGVADRARGPAPELEQEARQERMALEDYRKALYEAADDIRAQMNAELAARSAG
jgi:hypothetical protein